MQKGHPKYEVEGQAVAAPDSTSKLQERVFCMRRIRCRPLRMPPLFNWGDTTPNWSRAVDDYQKIARYNRMCELVQRRQRQD